MPTDIFEGSLIKLQGRVVTGHADARLGTFLLSRDGKRLGGPTAPLVGGRAELPWLAPEVPPEAESYLLEYRFQVEGDEYPGPESFRVWPRRVMVRVLRATDGAPFRGFAFRVKQAGADDLLKLPHEGVITHHLKKPAPFTLEAEPPGEITAWVKDKGRDRIFKATRKYKAAFVAPVPGSRAIEQMVNLATAKEGQDARGSLVTIKVSADGDAPKAPADRVGQEGDPIYVQVWFGRESKRNSPAPALLDASGAVDMTLDARGKVFKGLVRLGAGASPATFRVELGGAGGDTCEVKIGSTPACADASLKFENWRTLYYQLSRPSALAAPDLSGITSSLEAVKVRYEKYKELVFNEGDAPAWPAGAWYDGAMLGQSGRCLNGSSHAWGALHARFDDAKNPVGVHLLFCHTLFKAGSGAAQINRHTVALTKTSAAVAFPVGGAARVRGWELDVDPGGAKRYHVFPTALQDGGRGARNVKWKSLAAAAPHAGKKGDVPDDHVSVDWTKRRSVVAVKLPADAVAVVEAGESVEVSMDVCYCQHQPNGSASLNRQLLRPRTAAEGGAAALTQTAVHELGHSMKQVVKAVPPGLAATDHDRAYTLRGHQGSHCAEGIAQAVYDAAGKTGSLAGRTDCACVMYGESASTRPGTFCAKCKPFALAQALDDITQ